MEINVRGDKVVATKAIKDYIKEKIEKLDKYFENPSELKASVIIRVKDLEEIIEVTIPTSKFTLRREEHHKDLYAAIDLVVDKLERQIRKNKTKISNKYKGVSDVSFILDDYKEEKETSKIVKRKNIEMKPMDEEEAIIQLNLIDHDFFVFKNLDEECVSVIYKRKDKSYGIINVK